MEHCFVERLENLCIAILNFEDVLTFSWYREINQVRDKLEFEDMEWRLRKEASSVL